MGNRTPFSITGSALLGRSNRTHNGCKTCRRRGKKVCILVPVSRLVAVEADHRNNEVRRGKADMWCYQPLTSKATNKQS